MEWSVEMLEAIGVQAEAAKRIIGTNSQHTVVSGALDEKSSQLHETNSSALLIVPLSSIS